MIRKRKGMAGRTVGWGRLLVSLVFMLLLGACAAGSGKAIEGKLPADIAISLYQGGDVLGGDEVALSELLAGGTPVVLNMWAGLCPVCRDEMPLLEMAYRDYGDEVFIVGLDIGPFVGLGDKQDALELLGELGVTYPVGTTDDAGIVKAYQVVGTPSLFFIAPDGEIVHRWAGMIDTERLTRYIEDVLPASTGDGG